MTGRIVKALADFYYIYCNGEVFQCKAKGLFRKKKDSPLVGDLVEFFLTNAQDIEGNITEIYPRKSRLTRPSVANIDMVLLTFAVKDPKPNYYLLDRFLVLMENEGLPVTIVFNKNDLSTEAGEKELEDKRLYESLGYKCILSSSKTGEGLDEIKAAISGKVSSVAGPSGVGKSSIINALTGRESMETGEVSKKNKRGKQTTRHTELLKVSDDTFIVDTPGFSSTDITALKKEDLAVLFLEFKEYLGDCKFSTCLHVKEPGCKIKEAVLQGKIQKARYENYLAMIDELKDIRQY